MWRGRLSPRHVVILTHQLVRTPNSRTFAIKGGTDELKGWDTLTVISARTHNLIAALLQGLSNGKKQDGIFIDFPRKPEEPQLKTLADFSVTAFNRFMFG